MKDATDSYEYEYDRTGIISGKSRTLHIYYEYDERGNVISRVTMRPYDDKIITITRRKIFYE